MAISTQVLRRLAATVDFRGAAKIPPLLTAKISTATKPCYSRCYENGTITFGRLKKHIPGNSWGCRVER